MKETYTELEDGALLIPVLEWDEEKDIMMVVDYNVVPPPPKEGT